MEISQGSRAARHDQTSDMNSVPVLRVEHATGLRATMYTGFESLVQLDCQSEDRTHANKKTLARVILEICHLQGFDRFRCVLAQFSAR